MNQSSNPWEAAELSVNGKEIKFGDPLILIRGQVNDLIVKVPAQMATQLMLGLGDSGGLDVQSVPAFDAPVQSPNQVFSWKVTLGDDVSGVVTLVVYSPDVGLPWALDSRVISADLKDEVSILLDGQVIPEDGAEFTGDQSRVLTLDYLNGDVLDGVPLACHAILLTDLGPGDVTGVPALGAPTAEHDWTVSVSDSRGTFALEVHAGDGGPKMRTPVLRANSAAPDPEIKVYIEGVLIKEGEVARVREETEYTLTIETGASESVLSVSWGQPNGYFGIAMSPRLPFSNMTSSQNFVLVCGINSSSTEFTIDIKLDDGADWSRRVDFFVEWESK